MKKFITILLLLISTICNSQSKPDSIKIKFDKDGNVITQKYYSMKKEEYRKASQYTKENKARYKTKYGHSKSYDDFDFWVGDKVKTKDGDGVIENVLMADFVPTFILKIDGKEIKKFFYEEDFILIKKRS